MKNNETRKWGAKAEVILMGHALPVENNEEVKFITAYILSVIKGVDDDTAETEAEEVFNLVNKYNSENTPITHISVNTTPFGKMITFVRDEEMQVLETPEGVLAYVYNVDYPDCSELGYVFFEKRAGTYRRIA